MIRKFIFLIFLFPLADLMAQSFVPSGQWRGAIIGHTDSKDYFVRATIVKMQPGFFKGDFSIINSNYSGEFKSDMRLSGDKLELLNFQPVKEYPHSFPHIKDCFTGYFQLMMIGSDSVRILDLYRNPIDRSTMSDFVEDSVTGEMVPAFECFNFLVLNNKAKDTSFVTLERQTDSLLSVKQNKTDISNKRTTVTGAQFMTHSDTVTISVWDNNVIDGDSISIKFNDDWILTNQVLSRDKMIFKLPVTGKQNQVLMLAENLGKIPPNTAAITIQDATSTKTFYLQSDFKKSEILKIIKVSP